MEPFAAIVLAAGVSSRMGRFKPLLEIDGISMIRRVTDSMQAAGAAPVVVVTGYREDELRRHLADTGVAFLHNEDYWRTQMLDSLLMAMETLPATISRVLVNPADIPLVRPETIRALVSVPGDFVRPVCAGQHGHPIVLATRRLGIVPRDVEVEDQGVVLDSDTRDEYTRLLRYRREDTRRPQPLQLDLRVHLQAETSFWNASFAQFLELIQTTGSIRNACSCMHMAYSNAWKLLNEAERQLGWPLLVRSPGGSNGGGSELTARGQELLRAWRAMEAELQEQGEAIFRKYFPRNLNGENGGGA